MMKNFLRLKSKNTKAPLQTLQPGQSGEPSASTPSILDSPVKNHSRRFIMLSILSLIIVAVGAWLIIFQTNLFGQKSGNQPYRYTYSKLDSYSIPGQKAGTGISFKKPVELTFPGTSQPSPILAQLYQYAPNKTPKIQMAKIEATPVLTTMSTITADFLTAANKAMSLPKTDHTYIRFTQDLTAFVVERIDKSQTIDIAHALPFTNPNIKANAWQLNIFLKATNPSPTDHSTPHTYLGKAIDVYGKNAIYYFYVSAVSYNWQANQSTMQQVLDSIKVDQ